MKLMFVLVLVFLLTFAIALPDDAGTRIDFTYPLNPSTLNVTASNDSAFLRGFAPADFWQSFNTQTGLTGDKTGSFDLTTTGEITAGNNFITIIGDETNGASLTTTNVISQTVRLADANNLQAGFFSDGTAEVIILDGDSRVTFSGVNSFDIDAPIRATELDTVSSPFLFKVEAGTQLSLSTTLADFQDNDIKTTGAVKIDDFTLSQTGNDLDIVRGTGSAYIDLISNPTGSEARYKLQGATVFGLDTDDYPPVIKVLEGAAKYMEWYGASSNGENRPIVLYGYPTGLSKKNLQFGIVNLDGSAVAEIKSDSGVISFADEDLYQSDNARHYFGSSNDAWTYWDGTNQIFNTSTGKLVVGNSTGYGTVVARDFETLTDKWDKKLGSALDYVKDADDINLDTHAGFSDFETNVFFITDYEKPETREVVEEKCITIILNEQEEEYDSLCENVTIVQTYFPHQRSITSVSLVKQLAKHEQAIYELNIFRECVKSSKNFEEAKLC